MDHNFYAVGVQEVVKETPDAITLVLENHPKLGEYLAGQFLTIKTTINGESIRRAYSLCSSPVWGEPPAITIKAVADGKMSNWIVANAKPGMKIDIMPAFGNFVYQPHTTRKRWFMLYAAGSGITPIFSILKTILKTEPQSFVSLMFGNRSPADIMYRTALEKLMVMYPSRLKVLFTLTQPTADWLGPVGRINEFLIEDSLEYLKPVSPFQETLVYMCGPAAMMETIAHTVGSQGVAKENIHRENFAATVDELARQTTLESLHIENRQVVILLDGERFEVEVAPNTTILEAALDADIDMPYSCQSGLCTACRGKCLSGSVHMDERDGLDDQDIAEGFVLTCVGHPLSNGVVIEMG